jgi:hypothetical protein
MPTDVGAVDVSPAAVADEPPQAVPEGGLGRTSEPGAEVGAVAEAVPDVSAESSGPVAEPDVDAYAGMTLAELRGEADRRGVPSYGTKAQVAERLREADVPVSAESESSGE